MNSFSKGHWDISCRIIRSGYAEVEGVGEKVGVKDFVVDFNVKEEIITKRTKVIQTISTNR